MPGRISPTLSSSHEDDSGSEVEGTEPNESPVSKARRRRLMWRNLPPLRRISADWFCQRCAVTFNSQDAHWDHFCRADWYNVDDAADFPPIYPFEASRSCNRCGGNFETEADHLIHDCFREVWE